MTKNTKPQNPKTPKPHERILRVWNIVVNQIRCELTCIAHLKFNRSRLGIFKISGLFLIKINKLNTYTSI